MRGLLCVLAAWLKPTPIQPTRYVPVIGGPFGGQFRLMQGEYINGSEFWQDGRRYAFRYVFNRHRCELIWDGRLYGKAKLVK